MKMYFEHLDQSNNYLDTILFIIREGVHKCIQNSRINKALNESLITQNLCKEFNSIGMESEKQKIACFPERVRMDNPCREDIHFFLNDDNKTEIFFAEAKCLPKPSKSKKKCFKDEYVNGIHAGSRSKSPSGGIQRYKLLKHGNKSLKNNAIFAYIKNYTIDEWFTKINTDLETLYPQDSILTIKENYQSEYTSEHKYSNSDETFTMHHFWIDLT